MNIKNQIIKYSKEMGIDLIGFTDSDICYPIKEKLKLSRKLNFNSEFEKGTIEERINPKLLMSNVKTIIVIGISYPKNTNRLENIKANEVYFSSSSWGTDYHKVLKDMMQKLCNYIKTIDNKLEYKLLVDTSSLDDRYLAYKAGLGFYGKNNLLINEQYGSYIFLGSILTNLDIEVDKPINKACLNCNKCVEACPLKAINDNGILNSKKCLSYITQKKDDLTKEEIDIINNCIYGCDICQKVCPYNKDIDNHTHSEFEPSDLEFININDYKNLSNKEFNKKYGKLSGAWRGKKIIERNINIYKNKLNK
jgi:epoxyqueuosine reductase